MSAPWMKRKRKHAVSCVMCGRETIRMDKLCDRCCPDPDGEDEAFTTGNLHEVIEDPEPIDEYNGPADEIPLAQEPGSE
jgi:hypothetical protein